MRKLVLAIAVLGFAAFPATSAEITKAQHAALADRIAEFDSAMRANDMAVVLGVVPPGVLDAIAAQYGATVKDVIAATQAEIDAAMATVDLVSFSMDLQAGEFANLPDGTLYGLIPTETVMALDGDQQKYRSTTTTVAINDAGKWYLVRIDTAEQIDILRRVYPGFAEIAFEPGRMEAVTE